MEKLDAKEGPNRVPMFVSLGMAVIDELNFPMKEALVDVPGGSGLYGARPHPSLPESCPAIAC